MAKSPLPSAYAVKYMRRRAELMMTSTIRIFHPGNPVFDSTTGMTGGGTPTNIYQGPARIFTMTGSPAPLGDQVVSMNQTVVSIPYNSPLPRVDDVVEIQTNDDPALVGRNYRIVDVEEGGIASPVRHLTVSGVQPDAFSY